MNSSPTLEVTPRPDDAQCASVSALCWAELIRRRADCSHEGLFRAEPSQLELDGVERKLDVGADNATTDALLRGASNDCLAALFKRHCVPDGLRPLLTPDEYARLEAADDEEAAHGLLAAVGGVRGETLRVVVGVAVRVAAHERSTRMGARAMSTVFAPVLFALPTAGEPMEMLTAARRGVQLTSKLVEGAQARAAEEASLNTALARTRPTPAATTPSAARSPSSIVGACLDAIRGVLSPSDRFDVSGFVSAAEVALSQVLLVGAPPMAQTPDHGAAHPPNYDYGFDSAFRAAAARTPNSSASTMTMSSGLRSVDADALDRESELGVSPGGIPNSEHFLAALAAAMPPTPSAKPTGVAGGAGADGSAAGLTHDDARLYNRFMRTLSLSPPAGAGAAAAEEGSGFAEEAFGVSDAQLAALLAAEGSDGHSEGGESAADFEFEQASDEPAWDDEARAREAEETFCGGIGASDAFCTAGGGSVDAAGVEFGDDVDGGRADERFRPLGTLGAADARFGIGPSVGAAGAAPQPPPRLSVRAAERPALGDGLGAQLIFSPVRAERAAPEPPRVFSPVALAAGVGRWIAQLNTPSSTSSESEASPLSSAGAPSPARTEVFDGVNGVDSPVALDDALALAAEALGAPPLAELIAAAAGEDADAAVDAAAQPAARHWLRAVVALAALAVVGYALTQQPAQAASFALPAAVELGAQIAPLADVLWSGTQEAWMGSVGAELATVVAAVAPAHAVLEGPLAELRARGASAPRARSPVKRGAAARGAARLVAARELSASSSSASASKQEGVARGSATSASSSSTPHVPPRHKAPLAQEAGAASLLSSLELVGGMHAHKNPLAPQAQRRADAWLGRLLGSFAHRPEAAVSISF